MSSAMERTGPPAVARQDTALDTALERTAALDAQLAAVLARLDADPSRCQDSAAELRYIRYELADRAAELRAARDDTDRRHSEAHMYLLAAGLQARVAELEAEAAARKVPRQRRARHAGQGPLMRLVDGGKAALVPAAAIGALVRHTAAQHAAGVKMLAAALVVGVPAVTVAAAAAHPHPHPHPAGISAGQVTGGAHVQSAFPVTARPAPQRLDASVTRPAPRRKHPAAPAAAPVPLLPSVPAAALPEPSQPSQPSPSSQPSAQPSVSEGPVEGTLSVPVTDVTADPVRGAVVELDASGGPVPWGMVCTPAAGSASGCGDVAFSATHGVVPAGGYVDVTVTFGASARADGGTLGLLFAGAAERIQVTVTWQPVPAAQPTVTAVPSG